MATPSCAPKHVWTSEEEGTLVECLVELVSNGGWKSNNGTFRLGYLAQLVRTMANKLPGCRVRATTSHPTEKRFLNKSFPYYDELAYVFERDRMTGRFTETFTDVGSNEPVGMMYAHHDLPVCQMVGLDPADHRERGKASQRGVVPEAYAVSYGQHAVS
ncbi:retrotransposon protein [Cucumis melo var. makuwa]|uniref:Retrotransposon protein n=1 Tax=Cucumis melo var. makuwa TaxID=1194695 RepID=A0A5A7SRA0_CUCMM|nr:retrotransposon protein [Cucumis melo var. makuwa]